MNEPKVGVGLVVTRRHRDKTQILLHHRTAKFGPGYWAGGGGHVNPGESLEAAVLRELKEEAGPDLKVENLRFVCVLNFTQLYPAHYVGVEFAADWVSGEAKNISPTEATDWQWFDIDNLPGPLFPPVADTIQAYKSGRNLFDSQAQTQAA